MREVVCINIGQAGVQISNAMWELFCIEHGIGPDGLACYEHQGADLDALKSIFTEIPNGQFVPKVISIDLEPSVLDEVRTGVYRKLFHPDQLISGWEDAANNYARGHYTMGRKVIDHCVNQVRRVAQACSHIQGFLVIDSVGGGTGSGFSILLNERLSIEYAKKSKIQFGVYPSPKTESSVVSPYNTLMNTHAQMDCIDLSIIVDNEATYNICSESLMIVRPTFNNINRLISQILSSITVSLRFENTLNSDLDQLCTNLIPYPRIHFPTSHHAPLKSLSRVEHEVTSVSDLTRFLFTSSSQFVQVDCGLGRLMACVLQYRGNVSPKSVNKALTEIKRRHDINFVDWCPTGFKIGINNYPPTIIPSSCVAQTDKSVTMLCNTTAICQMWTKLNTKFDVLFSKRAFVHWFVGEGMEEGEFLEARDNVESIIKDYEEVAMNENEFGSGVDTKSQERSVPEINIDEEYPNTGPRVSEVNDIYRHSQDSQEDVNYPPKVSKRSQDSPEDQNYAPKTSNVYDEYPNITPQRSKGSEEHPNSITLRSRASEELPNTVSMGNKEVERNVQSIAVANPSYRGSVQPVNGVSIEKGVE